MLCETYRKGAGSRVTCRVISDGLDKEEKTEMR